MGAEQSSNENNTNWDNRNRWQQHYNIKGQTKRELSENCLVSPSSNHIEKPPRSTSDVSGRNSARTKIFQKNPMISSVRPKSSSVRSEDMKSARSFETQKTHGLTEKTYDKYQRLDQLVGKECFTEENKDLNDYKAKELSASWFFATDVLLEQMINQPPTILGVCTNRNETKETYQQQSKYPSSRSSQLSYQQYQESQFYLNHEMNTMKRLSLFSYSQQISSNQLHTDYISDPSGEYIEQKYYSVRPLAQPFSSKRREQASIKQLTPSKVQPVMNPSPKFSIAEFIQNSRRTTDTKVAVVGGGGGGEEESEKENALTPNRNYFRGNQPDNQCSSRLQESKVYEGKKQELIQHSQQLAVKQPPVGQQVDTAKQFREIKIQNNNNFDELNIWEQEESRWKERRGILEKNQQTTQQNNSVISSSFQSQFIQHLSNTHITQPQINYHNKIKQTNQFHDLNQPKGLLKSEAQPLQLPLNQQIVQTQSINSQQHRNEQNKNDLAQESANEYGLVQTVRNKETSNYHPTRQSNQLPGSIPRQLQSSQKLKQSSTSQFQEPQSNQQPSNISLSSKLQMMLANRANFINSNMIQSISQKNQEIQQQTSNPQSAPSQQAAQVISHQNYHSYGHISQIQAHKSHQLDEFSPQSQQDDNYQEHLNNPPPIDTVSAIEAITNQHIQSNINSITYMSTLNRQLSMCSPPPQSQESPSSAKHLSSDSCQSEQSQQDIEDEDEKEEEDDKRQRIWRGNQQWNQKNNNRDYFLEEKQDENDEEYYENNNYVEESNRSYQEQQDPEDGNSGDQEEIYNSLRASQSYTHQQVYQPPSFTQNNFVLQQHQIIKNNKEQDREDKPTSKSNYYRDYLINQFTDYHPSHNQGMRIIYPKETVDDENQWEESQQICDNMSLPVNLNNNQADQVYFMKNQTESQGQNNFKQKNQQYPQHDSNLNNTKLPLVNNQIPIINHHHHHSKSSRNNSRNDQYFQESGQNNTTIIPTTSQTRNGSIPSVFLNKKVKVKIHPQSPLLKSNNHNQSSQINSHNSSITQGMGSNFQPTIQSNNNDNGNQRFYQINKSDNQNQYQAQQQQMDREDDHDECEEDEGNSDNEEVLMIRLDLTSLKLPIKPADFSSSAKIMSHQTNYSMESSVCSSIQSNKRDKHVDQFSISKPGNTMKGQGNNSSHFSGQSQDSNIYYNEEDEIDSCQGSYQADEFAQDLEINGGDHHYHNNSDVFESELALQESDYLEQTEQYNHQLHFNDLADQRNYQKQLQSHRQTQRQFEQQGTNPVKMKQQTKNEETGIRKESNLFESKSSLSSVGSSRCFNNNNQFLNKDQMNTNKQLFVNRSNLTNGYAQTSQFNQTQPAFRKLF